MSKYVIVTESGGDVPLDFVERYHIEVVPMHVTFGGRNLDDGSFPVTDIFKHFRQSGEIPSTSGCTPQDFKVVFDRIHEREPEAHIVYLAYSAATTCSFESARIAAEGRNYVTRIDTKSVTAAQFLIVTNVARYVQENPDVPLADVISYAQNQVERARMAFIPGELDFLRAGGRLSNVAYLGAQLLRIKPVIEVQNGKLVATQKLRGSMEKAVMAMVQKFLTREPMDKSRIGLIRNDGLSPELQKHVEEYVREQGFEEITWIETGCVIASHSGPGSFGIAALALR